MVGVMDYGWNLESENRVQISHRVRYIHLRAKTFCRMYEYTSPPSCGFLVEHVSVELIIPTKFLHSKNTL